MATDEEYLDSLLKSMTDNESNRSMEEVMREVSKTPKEDDISFGVEDFFESSPELSEDILENISLLDDSAIAVDSDSADGVGELLEQDEWKLSLDDILAQAEAQSGEAEADGLFDAPDWGDGEPSIDIPDIPEISDVSDVSETAQEADPVNAENIDVTDLIDGMDNTDVDLAEINGLLKSADSKESANDDMLALLEGVDVDQMDAFSDPDADSEFSIFSESDLEKSASYGSGSLDQTDKKKEKKAKKEKKKKEKKSRLFGKKKKETGADFDEQMEDTAQDGLSLDGLLDSAENGEGSDGDGEKKLGLFSRVINYLMEEEEEEASDETQEAADGTGEAADKKASKKDKKKKSKKGKKGKEQEADSDEEIDEEEDSSKSKKKPKKEKKEKKEKPPKEKVKTERVLSTKKLLVLIAFCATITASIVVFSTFLPEYADKKNANEAFYKGDYETVYKLLYNKQLNSSDSIIFNRARIVLKLERKLQSYENNMTLNRQVEAVDALMQGVKCYHELTGADTYGASDELNALYQQICVILQNNYGISPEEAVEINAYDNVSYTTKLNSIVSGTAFSIPEETAAESE